jgi:hypothetical protein
MKGKLYVLGITLRYFLNANMHFNLSIKLEGHLHRKDEYSAGYFCERKKLVA